MKHFFLLIFALQFTTSFYSQIVFDDIYKGMESNYHQLSGSKPAEIGKHQNFYENSIYTIPDAADSFFVESQKSKKRYLKIVLNSDLTNDKGKSESKKFTKSSNYLVKKYASKGDEEYYSVHKNENYIGSIIYQIKNNKAILKLYAFNGQSFMSIVKQYLVEAKTNKFKPYIGETSKDISSNQRISLLKGYRDSYAIYTNHKDNWVAHQSFYVNWPPETLLLSFGYNGSQLKKELGTSYKIISYKINPTDNSLVIKISSEKKVMLIQILEKNNTQIFGVAIQ